MIGRDGALARRFNEISLEEFNFEQTKKLLIQTAVPKFEKIYRAQDGTPGSISDDAIDAAIRKAKDLFPDSANPEGPYKLLLDVMVAKHREAGANAPHVTAVDVSKFVSARLKLPLDPSDPQQFFKDTEELKTTLHSEVVDQHRATDAMVDLWRDINLGSSAKDSHKVLLIGGPTGAGKNIFRPDICRQSTG